MLDAIDAWIRRRGVSHPLIVPVLRNQLVLLVLVLTGGTAFAGTAGAWVAAGFAVMTLVLFSWARFFSRTTLGPYSPGMLWAVVLRFLFRLAVVAAALWACLVLGRANPFCILGGVAAGTLAPLFTLFLGKGTRN